MILHTTLHASYGQSRCKAPRILFLFRQGHVYMQRVDRNFARIGTPYELTQQCQLSTANIYGHRSYRDRPEQDM